MATNPYASDASGRRARRGQLAAAVRIVVVGLVDEWIIERQPVDRVGLSAQEGAAIPNISEFV